MHRIPGTKTTIKMYKQQTVCQKDNTFQSCSNHNNTLRDEKNILIANNNNAVGLSQVKTAKICNHPPKYTNTTASLDNKEQQTVESAFLQIVTAPQKLKYCKSLAKVSHNVDDRYNSNKLQLYSDIGTVVNSCVLDLEVNDDEKIKTDHVNEDSPEEYLKKNSDGAYRVRGTSFQQTSIFRPCPSELPINEVAKSCTRGELEYEIDVGTVLQGDDQCDNLTFMEKKPEFSDNANPTNKSQIVECSSFDASVCLDRNARRPMNAFLIFCKRHRAIVKERYKSLENRAITKILGDWWASLDGNEKHCFTNLAQKNKDAFFNANPNFKWYKLPAPPLRPSSTRPNSGIDTVKQSRLALMNSYIDNTRLPCTNTAIETVQAIPNYIKITEGTQMSKRNEVMSNRIIKDNEQALQMALSETTQFLANNMPTKSYYHKSNSLKTQEPVYGCSSSDDEFSIPATNDKSSRRCKGKIYQQLIKSGRIVASAKKMKTSPTQIQQSGHFCYTKPDISTTLQQKHFTSLDNHSYNTSHSVITSHPNTFSQFANVEKSEVTASLPYSFDLDTKIKELPALNLDAYLQRKHNTNKKKKFNTKKQRRAAANSVIITTTTISNTTTKDLLKQHVENYQLGKECIPDLSAANAVGSRKRKARKESITRRDISIIEQEISSIMPLTVNGCYYFNECLTNPLNVHTAAKTFAHSSATVHSASSSLTLASPTISSSSSSLSFEHLTADRTTSNASDLLILAEVAANRTDFVKQ